MLSGADETRVKNAASAFFDMLVSTNRTECPELKLMVLGPLPPKVPKVNNIYRRRLIIKFRNTAAAREFIGGLLREFMKDREYRDVGIFADVNPM